MRSLGILVVIGILAGCSSTPETTAVESNSARPIDREEALALLASYLAEHPDLARFADGEQFFAIQPDGSMLHTQGLRGR